MLSQEQILCQINDSIKPAVQRAYDASVLKTPSRKGVNLNPDTLGFFLQKEIDNRKEELSRSLYALDLHINKNNTHFNDKKTTTPPPLKIEKYVKEAFGGYQINKGDGTAIQMSKNATIEVSQIAKTDFFGRTIGASVEVKAYDPNTNTKLHFIDDNLKKPGFEHMYIANSEGANFIDRSIYWEDPMYNIAKNSVGASGLVAGALEIRELANFTPWRTGENLKNATGWYRKSNGIKVSLEKLKSGRGATGHRLGAKYATQRAAKFKVAGKICFGISVGISLVDVRTSLLNNDFNRNEVCVKATVDIIMGAVGVWGGPIGWGIAGTYFILDVFGAFGDWGQPSGIKMNGTPYGKSTFDADFEMDLIVPADEMLMQEMLKSREVKVDNTYVAPPQIILFKK